jgi:hypothetical protein
LSPRSLAARPTLFLTLALAALAVLLSAPAQSLARNAQSKHASATRHKPKGKHKRHAKKAKRHSKAKHGTAAPVATPPKPAICEDGSRPVAEGEGTFSCADGAEPVCRNGAEPTPTRSGTTLVCPTSSSTTEFSEAECEDGSAPERSETGSYACEDGSHPSCPGGSQPTLSDDGSMLACLTQGANGSSPSSPPEEEEGEGEAADNVRVAIAS